MGRPSGDAAGGETGPFPEGLNPTRWRPPSEHPTGGPTPYRRPRHGAWEPGRLWELLEPSVGLAGEEAAAERNPIWEPGLTGVFYVTLLHRWIKKKFTFIAYPMPSSTLST